MNSIIWSRDREKERNENFRNFLTLSVQLLENVSLNCKKEYSLGENDNNR